MFLNVADVIFCILPFGFYKLVFISIILTVLTIVMFLLNIILLCERGIISDNSLTCSSVYCNGI